MITSPYNFVPLSDKVVMPHWAKLVSHDIPFKDSESGVLELSIRAESPIYVRNGTTKTASDSDKNAFNNSNGNYFIPGSSIKGMLRSVMEIMSFGRMGNKVNDHRYSVRDFQNNDLYPKSDLSKEVLCGWLYRADGEYYLEDCGKPGRISHKTLDTLCNAGPKMSDFYKIAGNITPSTKSAKAKYDKFSFDKNGHRFNSDFIDVAERPIFKFDEEGVDGTIVFSGQPGVRNEPEGERASGKHLEFVFLKSNNVPFIVEEKTIENFFFAYYDHEYSQQKDDWKWRKKQLDRAEKIPVFFRKNEDGSFDSIKDMGLTLLYKINYENSIVDSIDNHQKESSGYDLAETIFGYAEKESALKGRVHISHAFVNHQVTPLPEKSEVLAGPRASYYPNYIEQSPNADGKVNTYKTFMDNNSKIRGWKRYPVHGGDVKGNSIGNDSMRSKFVPLPSGTEFSLQIHYHNLRKEELGALISAITFHNTAGLFHSIGSGKPLGYGKTTITIKDLAEERKLQLLKSFELYMDWALNHSTTLWFQLPQLRELFVMAKPGTNDSKLKYMQLTDFVNAKGRRRTDPKFALQGYSAIVEEKINIIPLGSEEELASLKETYDKEKALFENQQDIHEYKTKVVKMAENDFSEAWQVKKNELLSALQKKRTEISEKEKAEKKEQEHKSRIEKAASGLPPEWSTIDDFGNLANRIPAWQKKLPNGTIPENFQIDLSALLEGLISGERQLNSKKRKEWESAFESNKNFKKISIWLGETKAKELYNKLNGQS